MGFFFLLSPHSYHGEPCRWRDHWFHDAIREVVYVESRVDTDQDGRPDLIKVSIIRPRYQGPVPAVMTASPYHQGTNDPASDKALHDMNVDLAKKNPSNHGTRS